MSNTIASQTWEAINAANAALSQGSQTIEQGQKQVAEANNSQTARINMLQQLEKDVILPADPHGRQTMVNANPNEEERPQLPTPGLSWNGFQNSGEQQPGLIAIMGSVMCLQARMSSNFWNTLWQQASQSMMTEVKFAPIIGDAIEASYHAESLATKAQASQSFQDGIVNIVGFVGAGVTAGITEFNDDNNPLNDKDNEEVEVKSETKVQPNNTNVQEEVNENNQVNKELNQEEPSKTEQVKKTGNQVLSKAQIAQKRFSNILGRGVQAAQGISMLSQGVTGLFIDSKYQNRQAAQQGVQGEQQAISKEAEQYSQFYGQDFSRTDTLTQGASQNLDYAMNILKSAADTITQTVSAMFRG